MKQEESIDHHNRGLLLGHLVRKKREAAGLSQGELARRLGRSASYVSRLERGAFAKPQPQLLMALAAQLDIDLTDLYALTGCLLPTGLPSFPAYLRVKHPDWPDAVISGIVDHYEFVKYKHSLK